MKKPALMLPMGKNDNQKGFRLKFLESCLPILDRLGWTIGVQFQGELGDWASECAKEITALGGRLAWHIPTGVTKRLDEGILPELEQMAVRGQMMQNVGLEAATIHCAVVIKSDPPIDFGINRYFSPITSSEMTALIKAQVEPLRRLNEMLGGILHLENVSLTTFREGGHRLPTYLALQTGSWKDLIWLKNEVGAQTTFDSEHFFGAQNVLDHQADLSILPAWPAHIMSAEQQELAKVAGYFLEKGQPPVYIKRFVLSEYLEAIKPNLYHLGASWREVDVQSAEIDTHLSIDANDSRQRELLKVLLQRIATDSAIGAVIEVCGQLEPDKYDPWTPPHHFDDEVAKMASYLAVINEIERLQREG